MPPTASRLEPGVSHPRSPKRTRILRTNQFKEQGRCACRSDWRVLQALWNDSALGYTLRPGHSTEHLRTD
jgi:hypothetical protein